MPISLNPFGDNPGALRADRALPSPDWRTADPVLALAINRILLHFSNPLPTHVGAWDRAWLALMDNDFRKEHTDSWEHAQTARKDLQWLANWNALSAEVSARAVEADGAGHKLNAILSRRAVLALLTWPESVGFLDMKPEEVLGHAQRDNHAALLLYPAVLALRTTRS